jgi:hypothetical protein
MGLGGFIEKRKNGEKDRECRKYKRSMAINRNTDWINLIHFERR